MLARSCAWAACPLLVALVYAVLAVCVGLLPLCGPQRVFRRSSRVSLVVRPNLPLPLCNGAPPRSYSFDDARLLTSIGLNTSRACRQLLPSDGLLAFLGFASLSCSSGVTSLVLFLRSHFLPGLHGFLPFHLRPSLGRVSPPLPLPLYSCPLFGYKVDTRKNAASNRYTAVSFADPLGSTPYGSGCVSLIITRSLLGYSPPPARSLPPPPRSE